MPTEPDDIEAEDIERDDEAKVAEPSAKALRGDNPGRSDGRPIAEDEDAQETELAQRLPVQDEAQRTDKPLPVEDDAQRAEEAALLPVSEEEDAQHAALPDFPADDDEARELAAQPVQQDERPDDVAVLAAQAMNKEDSNRLGLLPVQEDDAQQSDRQTDGRAEALADQQPAEETVAALQDLDEDAPALPEPEKFPDLAADFERMTGQDRVSPSDWPGYTPEENEAMIADSPDLSEGRPEQHHAVPVAALRAFASADAQRDPDSLNDAPDEYLAEDLRKEALSAGFRELADELYEQDKVPLDHDVHAEVTRQSKVEQALLEVEHDTDLYKALWIAASTPSEREAESSSAARALREEFEATVGRLVAGDDRLGEALACERDKLSTIDHTAEILKRFDTQELQQLAERETTIREEYDNDRTIRSQDEQAQILDEIDAQRAELVMRQELRYLDDFEAAQRQMFDRNPGLLGEEREAQILRAIDSVRDQIGFPNSRRRR